MIFNINTVWKPFTVEMFFIFIIALSSRKFKHYYAKYNNELGIDQIRLIWVTCWAFWYYRICKHGSTSQNSFVQIFFGHEFKKKKYHYIEEFVKDCDVEMQNDDEEEVEMKQSECENKPGRTEKPEMSNSQMYQIWRMLNFITSIVHKLPSRFWFKPQYYNSDCPKSATFGALVDGRWFNFIFRLLVCFLCSLVYVILLFLIN